MRGQGKSGWIKEKEQRWSSEMGEQDTLGQVAKRRKSRTRATRKKLETALDSLDAFIWGNDYEEVLGIEDRTVLETARKVIADIEGDMYRKERR